MTTMTTEETATLPVARLTTTLDSGLAAGAAYPYLAVADAPVGYSGALILPPGTTAGWAIESTHHAALQPYMGNRAWWVRPDAFSLTGGRQTVERAVAGAVAGAVVDEGIPAEHRAAVPDGAYWVRMTRSVDGVPSGAEMLAMDDPQRPDSTRGPLLLIWPGHGYWRFTSVSRPGLPDNWHGWWAHGGAERIREVARAEGAEVDRPDLPFEVGQRVRVVRDPDEPRNAGRLATIVELDDSIRRTPFRVRYENDSPGGEHGWWVAEVMPVGPPAQPTLADRYPVGNWFTWGTHTDWFLIDEVGADTFESSHQWSEGLGARPSRRSFTQREADSYSERVCVPPGSPEMPRALRELTTPSEFTEGARVLLTSPHVTHPSDTAVYNEAARGVGYATGVLVNPTGDAGVWTVRWDNGGNTSAVHESCLTVLPAPGEGLARDSKVILVTPHHLDRQGGREYQESPHGIGSTGVIIGERDHVGDWRVEWLFDNGSSARRSRVHESCLALYPADYEPTAEPTGEPTGEVRIEGVPDAHAPEVPANAVWQQHTGGELGDGEFITVPHPTRAGRVVALVWPGHPLWDVCFPDREECPPGWRSFRTNSGWGVSRPVERITTPVAPRVGYEGVPEEHWASVPANARRVHYMLRGRTEWMAYPHNSGFMLIAWPGDEGASGMVHANHAGRLAEGVPADWTSWYVSSATDLGPWPTVEVTAAAEAGTSEAEDVEALRRRLTEVERQYAEDIARIAEIMKAEADRREWCAEYEEVARRIDRSIHAEFDGARPMNYEVHFSGMVPFSGRFTLSLPQDPTEEQVRDALRAHFSTVAADLVHYSTVDWSATDVSDLSVDEFDEE
jgi:hypothetical protein